MGNEQTKLKEYLFMNNKSCQNDCFNRFILSKVWGKQNESMHFLHSVAEKFNLTRGKKMKGEDQMDEEIFTLSSNHKSCLSKKSEKVAVSAT